MVQAMRSSSVDITTHDGVADAYLTRPDAGDRDPGVLFVMDAFGLRPRIEEMADRIAERGYAVLAPNILYCTGPSPLVDPAPPGAPERRGNAVAKLMPSIQGLDTESIGRDTKAYLDCFAAQPGVDPGPVV